MVAGHFVGQEPGQDPVHRTATGLGTTNPADAARNMLQRNAGEMVAACGSPVYPRAAMWLSSFLRDGP